MSRINAETRIVASKFAICSQNWYELERDNKQNTVVMKDYLGRQADE